MSLVHEHYLGLICESLTALPKSQRLTGHCVEVTCRFEHEKRKCTKKQKKMAEWREKVGRERRQKVEIAQFI